MMPTLYPLLEKLSPPLFALPLLLYSCGGVFGIGMLDNVEEGTEPGPGI